MNKPFWNPLETAPKDGREFIVRYPKQGNVKQILRWNTIHNHWESKGEAMLGLEFQGVEWGMMPGDDDPASQSVSSASPNDVVTWTDEDGVTHYMHIVGVREHLKRFYDEWPGGWDEVEAEQRTQRAVGVSLRDTLAAQVLSAFVAQLPDQLEQAVANAYVIANEMAKVSRR